MPRPRLVPLALIVVSVLMPGCASKWRCLAKYGIPIETRDTILVTRPMRIDTVFLDTIPGWSKEISMPMQDSLINTLSGDNVKSTVTIASGILSHSLTLDDTIRHLPVSLDYAAGDKIITTTTSLPVKTPVSAFYKFTLYYFLITATGILVLIIFKFSS